MIQNLINDKIIKNDQVYTVALDEIDSGDYDGRIFELNFITKYHIIVKEEKKIIKVSNTFLSMSTIQEADLYTKLIQFHQDLPNELISQYEKLFIYPKLNRDEKIYLIGDLIKTFFYELNFKKSLHLKYLRNSICIPYTEILGIVDYYDDKEIIVGYKLGSLAVKANKGNFANIDKIINEHKLKYQKIEEEKSKDRGFIEEHLKKTGATEAKTCQVKMNNNKLCNRNIISDGKCILHLDNKNKNVDLFRKEIIHTIESNIYNDFTNAIFPYEFVFPNNIIFSEETILTKCIFYDNVDLTHSTFNSSLTIKKCKFEEAINFSNSKFLDSVDIVANELLHVDFSYCQFSKALIFDRNSISIQLPNQDYHLDFHGVVFESPSQVTIKIISFNMISLRGANILSIDTLQVRNFNKREYILCDESIHLRDMKRSFDSLAILNEFKLVSETYKSLTKLFDNQKKYFISGELHCRAMELERTKFVTNSNNKTEHIKKWFLRNINIYNCYRLLSNYGESFWKPIIWFGVMIISVPLLMMYYMGENSLDFTTNSYYFPNGWEVWRNDFTHNLMNLISFDNGKNFCDKGEYDSSWNLLFIAERILSILFITFIVIAFKRKFKRY